MPKRIQRKRTKGWKMPAGAVYVGRPTKWGNEWTMSDARAWGIPVEQRQGWLAKKYRLDLLHGCAGNFEETVTKADVRRELRGKDLCCWCPLVDSEGRPVPCHAHVLLEVANR